MPVPTPSNRLPRSARRIVAGLLLAGSAACDCDGAQLTGFGPEIDTDPKSFAVSGVPTVISEYVLNVSNKGNSVLVVSDAVIVDEDGDGQDEFGIAQLFAEGCDDSVRPEETRNEIRPGACARLRFRYRPASNGTDKAKIVLTSNDADEGTLEIPITGDAQTPDLEVCAFDGETALGCNVSGGELEVDFGSSPPGTPVVRTLKLTSKGSRVIDIAGLGLTGVEDYVVTPMPYTKTLEPGASDTLTVTFNALSGGDRFARLVIESNDPAEGRLPVQFRALGDGPGLCYCIHKGDGGRCEPTPVADFGRVSIGGTGNLFARLGSCGTQPLTISGLEVATGGPIFSVAAPTLPVTLAANATPIDVPLKFQPVAAERSEGRLNIVSNAGPSFFTLTGIGYDGGCKLESASGTLDFGQVAVNVRGEKVLTLANKGDEACVVAAPPETAITAGADVQFALSSFPSNPIVLPGEIVRFGVSYTPQDMTSPDVGELTVPFSAEAAGSPVSQLKIALKGTPVATPVCVLTAEPGNASAFGRTLNFGQVRVHTEKVLPVTFRNVGSAMCAINSWRISSGMPIGGGPSVFKIKNPPTSALAPGASTTVDVSFIPTGDSEFGVTIPIGGGIPTPFGEKLIVTTSDQTTFNGQDCATTGIPPTGPVPGCVSWALSGTGVRSHLAVLPPDVDFGLVTLGCRSREVTLTLYNTGGAPIEIRSIRVDPAPPPEIFKVIAPALPVTLQSGQQKQITVRYRPPDTAIHTGTVYIETDALAGVAGANPYTTVSLRGEGTTETHQTDTFDQSTRPKTDVLFVIDDSGSMGEEQSGLANNASRFINVASQLNTDFQIGVVTTDTDSKGGELRGNPKIVKPGPNAAGELAATVRGLGTNGSGTEKGLNAMVLALTDPLINDPNLNQGFLRTDAKLAVVVVSDEEDYSPATVDFYTDFLKNLKGIYNQSMVSLSAIVGEEPGGCSTADAGSRYLAVQQRTGGRFRSICATDWGSIASELGLDAFASRAGFPLSRAAIDSTIVVKVNGTAVARPAWSYDPLANVVVFAASSLPPAGATVVIDYETMCF